MFQIYDSFVSTLCVFYLQQSKALLRDVSPKDVSHKQGAVFDGAGVSQNTNNLPYYLSNFSNSNQLSQRDLS